MHAFMVLYQCYTNIQTVNVIVLHFSIPCRGHPSKWVLLWAWKCSHTHLPGGLHWTLGDCSLQALAPSSTSYLSGQVLSVICQGNITSQRECSSGDLRLVGGGRESDGRVEICVEGLWGTVCDSGWGQKEATVVCSQSGYRGVGGRASLF